MAQNPNKQGSGYINLKNYLQASPGTALGSKISGLYNQDLGKSQASFGATQNQFKDTLDKSNINTSDNQSQRDTILSKPEDVINDPNKTSLFNRYLNPSFNTPSTSNLEQQAGITNQMSQDFANPGYKSNLLQRYVGQNNPYSMGQKTLDNIFLNTKDSNSALNSAKRNALQTMSQQKTALSGADSQIKQVKGENEQFGKDTQSKLNTRIGDYIGEKRDSLTNRLKDYQGQQTGLQTSLQTGLTGGNLSSDLATRLGLTQGQNLYNLGSQMGSVINNPNLSLSNISSPEERARVNALYQLRGETSPMDMTQTVVNPNEVTGVNKDFVQNYLNEQGTKYNTALTTPKFDVSGNVPTGYTQNGKLPGVMGYNQAKKYYDDLEGFLNNQAGRTGGVRLKNPDEHRAGLDRGRKELQAYLDQINKQFNINSRVNIG